MIAAPPAIDIFEHLATVIGVLVGLSISQVVFAIPRLFRYELTWTSRITIGLLLFLSYSLLVYYWWSLIEAPVLKDVDFFSFVRLTLVPILQVLAIRTLASDLGPASLLDEPKDQVRAFYFISVLVLLASASQAHYLWGDPLERILFRLGIAAVLFLAAFWRNPVWQLFLALALTACAGLYIFQGITTPS